MSCAIRAIWASRLPKLYRGSDIAGSLTAFEPNLYLYDNYPGRHRAERGALKLAPRLLDGAAKLLAACPCEAGCPSCVGPIGEVGERGKEVAGRIIKELL